MKRQIQFSVLLASTMLTTSGWALSVAAQAPLRTFVCKPVAGAPTTVLITNKGVERQLIRWTSDMGREVGYTPEKRCFEVTNRMNRYFSQGGQYITHGRMNNETVICMTDRLGKDCIEVVYTLQPQDRGNAKSKLEDLFGINNRNLQPGPLREPFCPTYVNIKDIVAGKTRFAQEVCGR